MQTLKHALGSIWGSRPDQSAASMTPENGFPSHVFSSVRIAGTGYSRIATRYSVPLVVSHELLMLFIAQRHGLEEIGKSRIRWDLEMRPHYGSIEHWRLMQVMIMHVMRCCQMLDQTSKQRMKQGTQTILTRGVVLSDGWMEMLCQLRACASWTSGCSSDMRGSHHGTHPDRYYYCTIGCSSPIAHVAMPQVTSQRLQQLHLLNMCQLPRDLYI